MIINTMQLSVIIPVYNAEHSIYLLVKEIKAVLHQYKIEIILVNDGFRFFTGSETKITLLP